MGFSVQCNGALGYRLFSRSAKCARHRPDALNQDIGAEIRGAGLSRWASPQHWAYGLGLEPCMLRGRRNCRRGPKRTRGGGGEPESASEQRPEGPRRGPRFLPPILRPKQLTQEEYEEAERLRSAGRQVWDRSHCDCGSHAAVLSIRRLTAWRSTLRYRRQGGHSVSGELVAPSGHAVPPVARFQSSRHEQRPRLGQPVGRTRVARL